MKKVIIRADGATIYSKSVEVPETVKAVAQPQLESEKEVVVAQTSSNLGTVYQEETMPATTTQTTGTSSEQTTTDTPSETPTTTTTGNETVDALLAKEAENSWTLMGVTMKKIYWILMGAGLGLLMAVLFIVALKK